MVSLKFTPNHEALAAYAQNRVTLALAELQARDKHFSVTLRGRTYPLKYELEGERLTIYSTDSSMTLTRSTLQLNVGAFLLPAAEYVDLPGGPGLNPGARQAEAFEVYEQGLAPVVGQEIVDYIQQVGIFKILGIWA